MEAPGQNQQFHLMAPPPPKRWEHRTLGGVSKMVFVKCWELSHSPHSGWTRLGQ
jgi:hypothetical protein